MAFVYIFQNANENYFKFGRRKKELSTGNPKPLILFDKIETDYVSLVESYLHRKFYKNLSDEGDAQGFYCVEPEELRKGLEEAKKFLAEYISSLKEAEQYKECEPDGTIRQPDDELTEIYRELCRVKDDIAGLKFEKEMLENKIKSKIGNADGVEKIAYWKIQIRNVLDKQALKEQHPDIYQQFLKEARTRIFRLQ